MYGLFYTIKRRRIFLRQIYKPIIAPLAGPPLLFVSSPFFSRRAASRRFYDGPSIWIARIHSFFDCVAFY